MIARREDVREHRQVEDLLHRRVTVGELQQVPVGVRCHHVLRLASDPPAHVDVAVRGARALRIDVQADPGVPFLAVATTSAGDVEGNGHDVTDLDELDAWSSLDHLTGDLVSQHQTLGSRGPPANHVLVGAADVRRHDPEDHPVRTLASDVRRVNTGTIAQFERGVVDGLDTDLVGTYVRDGLVTRHVDLLSLLLSTDWCLRTCGWLPSRPRTRTSAVRSPLPRRRHGRLPPCCRSRRPRRSRRRLHREVERRRET